MKRYFMSLDPGKHSVKLIGIGNDEAKNCLTESHRICFKTKTYDLQNGYIDVQGNSHKVVYGDRKLIIGDQGTDRSFNTSKTEPLHQIAAYTAIASILEPNTTDNVVDIVLACPITVLKSEKAKTEYKQMIKGDGPIHIEVDEKTYEFTIDNIMLKAEGSGVLYLRPELFHEKQVLVVDFGGLNMTVTLYSNGTCANPDEDRFAEEFGSVQLVKTVSNFLTAHNDGNIINFNTAEVALERGYTTVFGAKDNSSIKVIKDAKIKFFNDAMNKIAQRGISLKNLDSIIFVGGTTSYLHESIVEYNNGVITEDSQWTTAEGLFKIAAKKYMK